MKHRNSDDAKDTRCLRCGGSIVVEMEGLWTYRACARCGHAEDAAPGGLFSIAFFPARG
jgi:hypothetical protein